MSMTPPGSYDMTAQELCYWRSQSIQCQPHGITRVGLSTRKCTRIGTCDNFGLTSIHVHHHLVRASAAATHLRWSHSGSPDIRVWLRSWLPWLRWWLWLRRWWHWLGCLRLLDRWGRWHHGNAALADLKRERIHSTKKRADNGNQSKKALAMEKSSLWTL